MKTPSFAREKENQIIRPSLKRHISPLISADHIDLTDLGGIPISAIGVHHR
jgi:hypothetical protein